MFPTTPFLQLTIPRVLRALDRVKGEIWREVAPVTISFGGSQPEHISFAEARKRKFKRVSLPFHWGKLFDQGWFRLDIPRVKDSSQLYLHWQDQGEGTLYLDGTPYYGFDVAHRRAPLPKNPGAVFVEGLCLQSAIWHPEARGIDPEGSKITKAALCTRNDVAWHAWHDMRALYEIMYEEAKLNNPAAPPPQGAIGFQPPINNVSPLQRRLLRALDDAVDALDSGGLAGLQKSLRDAYRKFSGQADRIRAIATGHAHVDLVWLWPERCSEYKATHTFSTMNRLMDLYPEFVFGYTQTASYNAVKRISPRLFDKVGQRIRQGKWEALGSTEVESDTLIACGEALARSFILGQKSFRQINGKPSRILWLPDVFGYSGALPQIMKQTGVDFFFTTKLTWSSINQFPYSSFTWKGIDGSEVLVHLTQDNGYNQLASAEEIRRGARAYRQSDLHDEYLAPIGYGDGGGGVTEEMCERVRRFASIAGMPETQWGRIDKFFDKLSASRDRLPSWQGELYLEYHRGTLTSHGDLKAKFRACERALQVWEAARCALGRGEIDEHSWRRLVFAQFHDYIPGSSVWEVYEEGLPELGAIAHNALVSASKELSRGSKPAIFNPLPIERIHFVAKNRAVKLAPLSGAPIAELPALKPSQLVTASEKKIESGNVRVAFDAKGRIAALAFGEKGKNEIVRRGPLGDLALFADQPHAFDAWELDRSTLGLGKTVETPADVAVLNAGGFQGVVEFRRKLGKKSIVAVRYRVDAFQPVLHLEYEIDWHEQETLLKVLFPTAYTGRLARFGAAFGSVQRGQLAGPPRDEAMWESASSRWAIVGDDGEAEGLGVITEAKYGFSCREGELGVSLLRSPRVTGEDPGHGGLLTRGLRRGGKRDVYSDQGRHVIRLALCFHSPATPRGYLAPTLADTLFTPPITYTGNATSAGLLGLEGLQTLVPAWAKPAADGRGWILRLHETMGRRGKVRIHLAPGLNAYRNNLAEDATDKQSARDFHAKPYELISLRIR
jgi:alpha-mannosidase